LHHKLKWFNPKDSKDKLESAPLEEEKTH